MISYSEEYYQKIGEKVLDELNQEKHFTLVAENGKVILRKVNISAI